MNLMISLIRILQDIWLQRTCRQVDKIETDSQIICTVKQ